MNEPAKDIIYGDEARAKIKDGVTKLARAVKVTLGPCGRNVISKLPFEDSPTITKDGVSVAKEINLLDPFEDMGAKMVREVASKTSDIAGDGTTTATVYAEAIYLEGLRHLAAGADPMELKRGIDAAAEEAVERLSKMSAEVDDAKQIEQVATCSTNHDAALGGLIAEAIEQVGKTGVITVESGKGFHTDVEYVEGLQFDKGYLSPHFVKPGEARVEIDEPLILLCDRKIPRAADLVGPMQYAVTEKRPLLVIADSVDGEALATMVVNKMRGTLDSCAVKSPGFGDRAKALLGDLAVVTGATVFSAESDNPLDDKRLDHVGLKASLGSAKKVFLDKETCTIVEGGFGRDDFDKDAVSGRVGQLRDEIEETDSDWDREKLEERIAMMTGSIARIHVGGATETEIKEKKARVEDALHASRAAIEEGILPGGGVAPLRVGKSMADDGWAKKLAPGQANGAQIVIKALSSPLRQIVENAGAKADVIEHNVAEHKDANRGFDVRKGEYCDMIEAGIIVPTKVERVALQNAASIAGLMLTTEAMICEIPSKDEDNPTMPMG